MGARRPLAESTLQRAEVLAAGTGAVLESRTISARGGKGHAVSVKDKLARLGRPGPTIAFPRSGAPGAAPGVVGGESCATSGVAGPSASPLFERDAAGEERGHTLEALRAQMNAILGRPPAPVIPLADPASTELPFIAYDTSLGPVHRRFEHLAPSVHVGRIPVDAARDAEGSVLALLALSPALASVDMSKALFLDCETTGLGGAGTLPFLVGLAWFDDGRLVIEQLLLRTPAEEPGMLVTIAERVHASSVLVTFNGKTFDWPLLMARFVMNRLSAPTVIPHLDLLHVARRLHRRRLGSCRLTELEIEVLGYVRGPDVAGAEVAAHYAHFLRSGDEAALRAVIEHNAYDVLTMAALVGLYGEPLSGLHESDLVALAQTYRRARAWDAADRAAEEASTRGAGPEALRVRGLIAKARGDRARALERFEELVVQVDEPTVRLELAKLYEHFTKAPQRALSIMELGTGEAPEALARRRARLERKLRGGRCDRSPKQR